VTVKNINEPWSYELRDMGVDAVILYPNDMNETKALMICHDPMANSFVLFDPETEEHINVEQTSKQALQRLAERLDQLLYGEQEGQQMPSLNWDHQTLGIVYTALVEKEQEMNAYVRDTKAQGMSITDGYEQDLERLTKACKDVGDLLGPQ
jgi:hypothetical protein